ncbi:MAG TPA: S9 family peptidase [Acidimicrobiales bacterium]|jgi:oligopeptidase B|nr:S9 family peptidase [Acidimicrobiales bacterium]
MPSDSSLVPPVPERRPVELKAHGDVRVDDWYWLADKEDPAVIAHLTAENAYTEAVTAPAAGLRAQLFEEIVARIEETDLSVPARKGPWMYYSRTVEGSSYNIHCRKPAGTEEEGGAGEEVILDENLLSQGLDYFAVGNLSVSPDHRWLAYSTDTTGGERYTMRFRDLETGEEAAESLEGTYYGAAWANDNATLFYVRVDEAMRPHQLWRHRVGNDPSSDVLAYQEPDERYYLGVARTKDDRFILCGLDSKVTSEYRVLSADDPDGEFTVVEPRRQGIEYSVDHDRGDPGAGREGRFLIVTNDGAEDFRLMEAPDASPGRSSWTEVIPAREGVRLDAVDPFANHLVVYEREDGETRMRVIEAATGVSTPVDQPETPSTVWEGPNPEYDSTTLRYEYTSMVTPRSVFDLDLETGGVELRKRQPVLGDFDPEHYTTERRWAEADDGTRVPISLVYRTDRVAAPGSGRAGAADAAVGSGGPGGSGGAPMLLYGYGSYEASMDPTFSSLRLSLLDRGFVFAIAHVRGGGEMGRRWYEEGKFLAKPNTFTDFVACARMLVDEGWTSPDRLVARGGSAGGLLMGAVANLAPELFRAIVAEVPFVDCLTTILDDSLPLTVLEWEEWGNPVEDPEIYAVMKSYSPYDNVRSVDADGTPVRYPDILATGGLSDPRVGFWEPAKWVAKLRAANPENRVLLKTEMGAGHGGPSGRYDAWKDEAFVYAFILDALGLAEESG